MLFQHNGIGLRTDMQEHLTEKIRQDFDRIARYDQEQWDHNNHYHRFLLNQLPAQSSHVLDIGCGTGEFARLLAKRAARVTAIDLSPTMIKVAKQRSQELSTIDFQVADILQWELPVERFDAIVSIATLHHLPIERMLPILSAALKPGGKLVILDLLTQETLYDKLTDGVAVPLNWLFQRLHNRYIQSSPEAEAALREHIRTDTYLTFSQAQQIYTQALSNATVRKHLFWRYSVVWEKSIAL